MNEIETWDIKRVNSIREGPMNVISPSYRKSSSILNFLERRKSSDYEVLK